MNSFPLLFEGITVITLHLVKLLLKTPNKQEATISDSSLLANSIFQRDIEVFQILTNGGQLPQIKLANKPFAILLYSRLFN